MYRFPNLSESEMPLSTSFSKRLIAGVAFFGVMVGSLSGSANAATNYYTIHNGEETFVVTSESHTPEAILSEAGLELNETDTYTTETDSNGDLVITIRHEKMVSVYCDGLLTVVGVQDGTVADLLSTLSIELGEEDRVTADLNQEVFDGMSVEVVRVRTEVLEDTSVTPFDTVVYEDASIEPGTEYVLVTGQDEIFYSSTVVTYENGEEVSREVTSSGITQEGITQVVLRGPQREMAEQDAMLDIYEEPAPVVSTPVTSAPASQPAQSPAAETTVGNTTIAASRMMQMEATAYTCGDRVGITATGTVACVGTVAVDPSVIPLGTKMYIVSPDGGIVYGYCTALDTGGVIKGNKIDLYYNTYTECWNFGRRVMNVYILD